MRVWIEYEGSFSKEIDKEVNEMADRHEGEFTGSGMAFSEPPIRDLEYQIPHKELAGFFTEVTDHWKKFKLHRVVVHAK
jgi:hypothetical protein